MWSRDEPPAGGTQLTPSVGMACTVLSNLQKPVFVHSDLGIGSVLLFCTESVFSYWVSRVCLVVSSQSCSTEVGWFRGCYLGRLYFVLCLSFRFALSLYLPGSQLCRKLWMKQQWFFTLLCLPRPRANCARKFEWNGSTFRLLFCTPKSLHWLKYFKTFWTLRWKRRGRDSSGFAKFWSIERKRGVLSP